jgi:thiol-disulfide isomerase/thioredoxin
MKSVARQMTKRGSAAWLLALWLLAIGAGASLVRAEPAARNPAGLDLGKYRGKVVMVDFWASWCGPCKLAFPFMAQMTHRYRKGDLVVITINEERQRAAGEGFLRQVRSTLPVVWDSNGAIGKSWSVNEMPTTLLFDRSGKMRFRHQGFTAEGTTEYQAQLDSLIKEH